MLRSKNASLGCDMYTRHSCRLTCISASHRYFYICNQNLIRIYNLIQGRSQGVCHGCMCNPLLKKTTQIYFFCRIISFYTNNPKCQYVYLSFYLNDYQIIEEWNWKISYFRQEVTFNLDKESTFSKKKIQHE